MSEQRMRVDYSVLVRDECGERTHDCFSDRSAAEAFASALGARQGRYTAVFEHVTDTNMIAEFGSQGITQGAQ